MTGLPAALRSARTGQKRVLAARPRLTRGLRRLGLGLAWGIALAGLASCVPPPPAGLQPAASASPLPAASASPLPAASTAPPETPEDRVDVSVEGDSVQVDIYSPSGIGSANVEVPPDPAPRRVLLRFHLRGLEQWQFTYGGVMVTGSLSSHPPYEPQEAVRRAGGAAGEQAVLPGSPYWMPARIVAPPGVEPGIPLQAGYIEVEAPPDYLARGGRFSLRWIDFYR